MNRCVINVTRSPVFQKAFKKFTEQYPRLVDDLKDAFDHIEQAPRSAAEARRMQGKFGGLEVYKYRCKSTDLERPANKAFRIIGIYEPERNRMTVLAMYLKPNSITEKEVIVAIRALTEG